MSSRLDDNEGRFRLLPASDSAERGVICSFMLRPLEVGGICAEMCVTSEHFHSPAHGAIYGQLLKMWDAQKGIDILTLTQALADQGTLEQFGGAAYLSELNNTTSTAVNVRSYIGTLIEKRIARLIITTGTEFASRGYEDQDAIVAVLDEYEGAVMAIAEAHSQVKSVTMKAAVMEAVNGVQELYDRHGKISGLETGFELFDKMTDGMHPGEMIIIAARPSMGKTAFAMNIAEHVAVDLDKPVGIFSLEMSLQQLVQRLLFSRAKINLQRVRDGFMSERDFPALTMAASKLAESRMHIDDASGLSILEVRARARRMRQQHKIELLVIDYLQLLKSGTKRAQDNRQVEIAEISGGLKGLAKELGIPLLVLAQLNRNVENRTGDSKGRPRLADLRESGSIEQDADLVGLLTRDEYYAETPDAKEDAIGKATLIIAKQRNGPVGDIPLTFLKEFTRFETRAEEGE